MEAAGSGARVELVGVGPGALVAVEALDRRQVVSVELEAEHVEVLRDPRRGDRLGDDDVPELQVPAQDHLGGRAVVPARYTGDGVVLQEVTALRVGATRLGRDALL